MFDITRVDGRSNQQVVIDLVKDSQYGTTFTYRQFEAALGKDRNAARQIVLAANRRLCRDFSRVLVNVRNVGYRIAHAREHVSIADWRKDRARKQMKQGLLVLRHVDWDQLDPQSRAAHEGTLMVMEAMFAQQTSFEKRLSRIEQAISVRKAGSQGHVA